MARRAKLQTRSYADRQQDALFHLIKQEEEDESRIRATRQLLNRAKQYLADRPARPPSGVYFIEIEDQPLVKIGFVAEAGAVRRRLSELQVGCPFRTRLVLLVPGFGLEEEAKLHRMFAPYAFRGEWFRQEGRLAELIELAVREPERAMDLLFAELELSAEGS